MKTGVELIAKERQKQIEKHGRTIESDSQNNNGEQLAQAASCLSYPFHYAQNNDDIPDGWDRDTFLKLWKKPHIKKLVIAGALIAAEIDRLQYEGVKHED